MKPLEKVGDLVDFKENLIYEEYKDQPLYGAVRFKRNVKEKYGFRASSDLYTKLVNYQIKKYGEPITLGTSIAYVRHPETKSWKSRRNNLERANAQWQLLKFMERNDESKRIERIAKEKNR